MLIAEITWINDTLNQMSNRQMDTCREIYRLVCCNYSVSHLQRVQLQRIPAYNEHKISSASSPVQCEYTLGWPCKAKTGEVSQLAGSNPILNSKFRIHLYSRGTGNFIQCSVCMTSG